MNSNSVNNHNKAKKHREQLVTNIIHSLNRIGWTRFYNYKTTMIYGQKYDVERIFR